jgi:DNA anti-recombination protein RmuC
MISYSLGHHPLQLSSQTVHAIAATSSSPGLTAAQATIIAAVCSAIAILTVGILNVATQRRQLTKQEQQSNRQLGEQRKLLERQLEAQREQFDRQLSEQRELRAIETEAEVANMIRAEKKAAYVKMLTGSRSVQATWALLAYQHPQSLMANLDSAFDTLSQEREQMRTGLGEIELLGSQDVIKLVNDFSKRTGDLLSTFVDTSESAIRRVGQPTPDTLAEAQKALRDEINKGEASKVYREMQETMRREILGEAT